VNIFQFALLLVAILFGGHSALHRWDLRTTRRALLQRACRAPEIVARVWVEGRAGEKSAQLWLQFAGGKPHAVAKGSKACTETIARLTAAGIAVDTSAFEADPKGALQN
jgi:hypothetical protein